MITYYIDPETRLIVTTARGVVTNSKLQDHVKTVLSDPEVRPGFNELGDLRAVTGVQISDREIGTTIQAALESGRQVKETNTALVASDGNADEISKVYELLRTRVPATVRLFQELSAARAWLGVADDDPQASLPLREAPRKQLRFLVACRSGVRRGSAWFVDISPTGARLESTSICPAQGMLVEILVHSPEFDAPIGLKGTVVRHTDTGFAIQFLEVAQEDLERMGVPS